MHVHGYHHTYRFRRTLGWAGLLGLGFFLTGAWAQDADQTLLQKATEAFKPLPADMATAQSPLPKARVELGRKLFFDPRLSADGTIACATCHRPALYGTDALPKSIGVKHRPNARNAPTVLNAALQFTAHWTGNRADVEDQATQALIGHASFGNPDYAAVVRKIKAMPDYPEAFRQAFPDVPDPIQPNNWGKAIGAYERTLVSSAPFDAFLNGRTKALSGQARRGLSTFLEVGCASCHNGTGVGGDTFKKFGVFEDYWKQTGSRIIDEGRFKDTKNEADKFIFKVPSLRNVAMTPPYFHDGSVTDLARAIRIMGKLQLRKDLNDRQIDDLIAFLQCLTGPLPKQFATEPVLAPSAFSPELP